MPGTLLGLTQLTAFPLPPPSQKSSSPFIPLNNPTLFFKTQPTCFLGHCAYYHSIKLARCSSFVPTRNLLPPLAQPFSLSTAAAHRTVFPRHAVGPSRAELCFRYICIPRACSPGFQAESCELKLPWMERVRSLFSCLQFSTTISLSTCFTVLLLWRAIRD